MDDDLGGNFPLFLVQHPNVPYRDFEMATSKQTVLDVFDELWELQYQRWREDQWKVGFN